MNAFVGKICPYCKTILSEKDDIVICSKCEMPHHKECWIENGGCTTFGCDGNIQNVEKLQPESNKVDQSAIKTSRCPNCGNTYSKNEKFCGRCGYNLEQEYGFTPNIFEEKSKAYKTGNYETIGKTPVDTENYNNGNGNIPKEVLQNRNESHKDEGNIMKIKYCRNCGKDIAQGSVFCRYCATKVECDDNAGKKICTYCNKYIPTDSSFCCFCGNNVNASLSDINNNLTKTNKSLSDKVKTLTVLMVVVIIAAICVIVGINRNTVSTSRYNELVEKYNEYNDAIIAMERADGVLGYYSDLFYAYWGCITLHSNDNTRYVSIENKSNKDVILTQQGDCVTATMTTDGKLAILPKNPGVSVVTLTVKGSREATFDVVVVVLE